MAGPQQNSTTEELESIKDLGYKVIVNPNANAVEILKEHFPGLDILTLSTQIDNILTPLNIKQIQKVVKIDGTPPPTLFIEYWNVNFSTPNDELYLGRTFKREADGLVVEHNAIILPLIYQGQKIGMKILAAFLQQYESAGVEKIKLNAALSTGGYSWARAGFKATDKAQVDIIRKKARGMLKPAQYFVIKELFDHYYSLNPNGKAFSMEEWARLKFMKPVLLESKWDGELDLTDLKELTNFKNYVNR